MRNGISRSESVGGLIPINNKWAMTKLMTS